MTTNASWILPPASPASLAIRGETARFPVGRIFCVGRNYAEHAAEMGFQVDRATMRPFYFTKTPQTALVEAAFDAQAGLCRAEVPYPTMTEDWQHEVELVVALRKPAFRIAPEQAADCIYGYALGLDMTRRDLQRTLRDGGKPWDVAKDTESGAICTHIVPMPGTVLTEGEIALSVNGTPRQQTDLNLMLWNIPDLLADLSQYYHLQAGDLLFTGTPAGVGKVVSGDVLDACVAHVGAMRVTVCG